MILKMQLRCSGLTKSGTKCKRNSSCRWHVIEACPVCFEDVQFSNRHMTTCHHVFHQECIRKWFETSDECPICRREQIEDPFILFKHNIRNTMSENYMDAIRSLEEDVTRYRRRLRALRDR
jgi:hypothetical protein